MARSPPCSTLPPCSLVAGQLSRGKRPLLSFVVLSIQLVAPCLYVPPSSFPAGRFVLAVSRHSSFQVYGHRDVVSRSPVVIARRGTHLCRSIGCRGLSRFLRFFFSRPITLLAPPPRGLCMDANVVTNLLPRLPMLFRKRQRRSFLARAYVCVAPRCEDFLSGLLPLLLHPPPLQTRCVSLTAWKPNMA